MVGIYYYENGLKFSGIVANTEQEAKIYLGNKYGKNQKVFTGKRDNNNFPIYENKFVPSYNEKAFVIKEIELATV